MKRALNVVSRTPILAIFVVIIVASMSFALFNVVSQPAASPSAAATATPTPTLRPAATLRFPTPWPTSLLPTRTPLPTPDLGPTSTPTPIIPTPVWTPIPPVVTNWVTYTGKSGFSFSYPSGWYIREDIGTHSPSNPAVTLIVVNYDPAKIPPKTSIIPGAMILQLLDYEGTIPTGGTSFEVGPQKFAGLHFLNDFANPGLETRGVARSIVIHFTAGKRQWVISGGISPPKEGIQKYSNVFYQIIGSLRYANQ